MLRALKILLMVGILSNVAAGLFAPIYAIFVEEIGGDILAASGAWAVYSFVSAVLILVMGKIEDIKVNRRKAVVIGYVLETVAFGGYLLVSTPFHLFIVQALLGVAFATYAPAWDAIYSRSLEWGKESFQWSLWEGFTSFFEAAAAIAGGIIAAFFGFRVLFAAMFSISLVGTILVSGLLRKHKRLLRYHKGYG